MTTLLVDMTAVITLMCLVLVARFIRPDPQPASVIAAVVYPVLLLFVPLIELALCGLAFHGLPPLEAIRNSVLIAANNILEVGAIPVLYAFADLATDAAVVTIAYGPAWSFPLSNLNTAAYASLARNPIGVALSFLSALVFPLLMTLVVTLLYVQWVKAIPYPGTRDKGA